MTMEATCLGLHVGHDRAISLVQNGQVTFHLAVERLDRKKHSDSPNLPLDQLRYSLERLQVSPRSIASVAVTYHAVQAERISSTLEGDFREAFPGFTGSFAALDHHLAHALGALVCSPFQQAAVLIADGAGDLRLWGSQAESVFHVARDHFYLLDERVQDRPSSLVHRPEFFDINFFSCDDRRRQISLGLKYEQLTYLCGFGPGQAGQTMALAGYGSPLFDVTSYIPKDLTFSLRYVDLLDRIQELASASQMTLRQFARVHRADIAATAQVFLQVSLERIVDWIVTTYDPPNLCFAGGVFLNCPTNRAILSKHFGRGIFFLPASHDEGQSIGAAAYAHWRVAAMLPSISRQFPYLGFDYSGQECEMAFRDAGLEYETLSDPDLAHRLAKLLAKGKICALHRGRSESGPRALGHRSILADPRMPESKVRLDHAIKRREEFRPYAPMVLHKRQADYFDTDQPSPYMLLTARVTAANPSLLQAVTHVDGTARIQSVSATDDSFLYELLTHFEMEAGVAALLNTSFNNEREPIVESPEDAVRTFLSTDLDVLVLGSAIHVKPRS
jgi:carbamoyltransferase